MGGRLLWDDAADAAPFEQRDLPAGQQHRLPLRARCGPPTPATTCGIRPSCPTETLVAVMRAPLDGSSGEIAIYSAATAQLVRVVSSGPSDNAPTWSPDGHSLAFARGDGRALGDLRHRRARLRAADPGVRDPARVGERPADVPRLTGPKRARAARRVRLRVTGALWGARVRLQRRAGGRWRTLATRRAGARDHDVQAAPLGRPRCAARSGPAADGRLEDARRAAAVARANVNGGWVGVGSKCRRSFRPREGTTCSMAHSAIEVTFVVRCGARTHSLPQAQLTFAGATATAHRSQSTS